MNIKITIEVDTLGKFDEALKMVSALAKAEKSFDPITNIDITLDCRAIGGLKTD